MKKFACLLCLFTLACATPEEIQARKEAQAQADRETCRSYGLKTGSEAFGSCLLQLDLARQEYYNRPTRYYGGYHSYPGHFISGVGVGF